MAQDVQIKCTCGKVTGLIRGLSSSNSNHVQCPCKGCQSYAHYLGRTDDMLDAEGYSNIFQINPSSFEIHEGMDQVACVRITPKGPLRWHTSCCNTPLGNTLPRGGVPFLGVLPICTGHRGVSDAVVSLVGPVRGTANERKKTSFGQKMKNLGMLLHLMRLMLMWRIRGGRSWQPFFDKETMRPIKKPIKVSDDERAALYKKVI